MLERRPQAAGRRSAQRARERSRRRAVGKKRAMKTPRGLIGIALPALLLLGLTAATPQAGHAVSRQEGTPSFSLGVSAVALDVVVTDTRGRFVRGLAQDDFLIMEEGIPQELAFFTSEGTPVTVLLLLDSSASVRANPHGSSERRAPVHRQVAPRGRGSDRLFS